MNAPRAPRQCPVCAANLMVSRLVCHTCGTGLVGEFDQPRFGALDAGDEEFLQVFLRSRGNMAAVQQILGVSASAVQDRFNDLLHKLGLDTEPTVGAGDEPLVEPATDPRSVIFTDLAAGRITVQQAATLLDVLDDDQGDPVRD